MESQARRSVEINGSAIEICFAQGLSGLENPLLTAKLIPQEELADLGGFFRRRGKRISFTTGVYDMIHIGHSRYLQMARDLAGQFGCLVTGLNSDKSVKALKGPYRPILPERQRAEMLSFLGFVDYISIYDGPNGAEIIKLLRPDVYLCVEGSWEGDIATKEEVKAMAEVGGSVYYTPRQEPSLSTTEIISRIEGGVLQQFQEYVRKASR